MNLNSITSALLENPSRILYAFFKDRQGNAFSTYPHQDQILADIVLKRKRFVHVQQCTQTGKTEILALALALCAILRPRERINVIAPTFRQTQEDFQRVKSALLYHHPDIARRVRPRPLTSSEIHIIHDPTDPGADSIIACHTAAIQSQGESILGFWGTINVLDEAGSIPDPIYHEKILRMGASSTSRSMLIKSGTPHRRNHFLESSLDPTFEHYHTDVDDALRAGALDQEYIDFIRPRLHPRQWRTWYLALFPEDEDAFFPSALVEPNIVSFEQSEPSKHSYALGLDFGKLENQGVFTLGELIGDTLWERKILAFRGISYTEQLRELHNVCDIFHPALAFADAGGVGEPIIEKLEERTFPIKKVVRVNFSSQKTAIYTFLRTLFEGGRYKLLNNLEALTELQNLDHEWIGRDAQRLRIEAPSRAVEGVLLGDDHPDSKALLACALRPSEKRGKGEWFDPIVH